MFSLVLFPFLIILSKAAETAPIVSLDYATFQGVQAGNLTKFLGMPFGQLDARFGLPKPPKSLHGVQNATVYAPACPQQALSSTIPITFAPDTNVVEDCLFLDVFKPTSSDARSRLPVLVWLYGGYVVGNSAATDPTPVVERSIATGEPIIIVTPNYRVSAFGFLAGKEVSAAGVTNLGLRDQILALEWVQKHISAFGGDPERVVLGGVSAGAFSTGFLLLSNKQNSNALFRGAFMISGSPVSTGTVEDFQPYYDTLVAANNCTHSVDTLDCLRRTPLESFTETVNQNTPDVFGYQSISLVWSPRVDGDVLVKNALISIAEGAYAKIPFISGDSDDEGTLFSYGNQNITTSPEFLDYVHSNYLPAATPAQITQIGTLYPDDPTKGSPFDTGTANQLTPEFKRLAAFQGDLVFVSPRRFFMERASLTQDTWSWLNKRGKATPDLGAFHFSDEAEIWFTTNSSDTVGMDAFINFINTLDPNGSVSSAEQPPVSWPKYNTPSSSGNSSLFTFSDPYVFNVTADNFRVQPIQFLYNLQLSEAIASSKIHGRK
ncbi:Alpha/Beta hydrolase protein [Mycena sp. CBHHK59/15]|nr:Alpha/Beta hydrolase protein [Mycena sp. CBHHK59/15]